MYRICFTTALSSAAPQNFHSYPLPSSIVERMYIRVCVAVAALSGPRSMPVATSRVLARWTTTKGPWLTLRLETT
eukprot:COSAG01_NODE_751_length_13837_cov_78.727981_9_plen_75_part_00